MYSSEAFTSTVLTPTSDCASNTTSVSKSSQSTQTNHHPDIPYNIEMPLPPIFNSCLVRQTKPSNYLSRSHPNLATIKWIEVTEEDLIEDQVCDMEMEEYDREVKDFYKQAAEKAKALREVFTENLFDEY